VVGADGGEEGADFGEILLGARVVVVRKVLAEAKRQAR
jgi:hypothetical protein